jgi:hypothetical protein
MVSLADKFAAALNDDLSGMDVSKGVDAASGSMSVLVSSETNTASKVGILALCWDAIVGGNSCCGGLVQGNVAAFGTRMCVEEFMPGLGWCSLNSHDLKASLPESLTKTPQDKAWFLEGVAKGRRLVTVDQSWPVAAVPYALLQPVKPLPVNKEWVALLDGLQTVGDASANAVQEFAARVKEHLMAVTPRMKKERYERETSATPESWEQFVELDSSQFLAINSMAFSTAIQKKLRENVDAIWSTIDGVGRDLSSFQQAVGQDLDLQENVHWS